jgi:hypothetical protein
VCLFLLACSLKWLASKSDSWDDVGGFLVSPKGQVIAEAIAVGGVILLTVVAPDWGRQRLARWERSFARFAAQRKLAIVTAAVLPMIVRLALLPAIPIPEPKTPDEFGYLLLADTFASGRITNPTHPLWRYFETLYIFHQPAYTTLYPIVSGALMAIPMLVGISPWFGVCLSFGLMCAALCWMLQGWLPPKWAFFGALLAGARLAISSYWINSYWGGAAGAIGGALLLGALPRVLRRGRVADALMAALGIAVLSQSRPFEGALLTIPVGALLAYGLWKKANRRAPALAALTAAALFIAAGTAYYNWRATGNPLQTPYQWHQRLYGMPQNLRWSAPVTAAARLNAQKDIFQNFEWQLGLFKAQSTWSGLAAAVPEKIWTFWRFFGRPLLTLPLLFLPFAFRQPPVRYLALTGSFVLLGEIILYPFFFPHYAAPLYGLLLVLIVGSSRYMRVSRWRGRRFGAPLFQWWVIAVAACCLLDAFGSAIGPSYVVWMDTPRAQMERDLRQRGGKHIVVVHYGESHDYHDAWIYNAADIDRSPVIWAREFDPDQMLPLLQYYRDRRVWLVNADDDTPELVPYKQGR